MNIKFTQQWILNIPDEATMHIMPTCKRLTEAGQGPSQVLREWGVEGVEELEVNVEWSRATDTYPDDGFEPEAFTDGEILDRVMALASLIGIQHGFKTLVEMLVELGVFDIPKLVELTNDLEPIE